MHAPKQESGEIISKTFHTVYFGFIQKTKQV